jgi:hypothetical protein
MKIKWPIEESRAIYKDVQLQEVMHTHKRILPLCVSLWSKDDRVDMVVGVSSANKGQDKNCIIIFFIVQIFGAFYKEFGQSTSKF